MPLKQISRRKFIQQAGLFTLASALPFNLAFAAAPGDKRLMLVIQRGAMDGLGAVVPFGDRNYAAARGDIAIRESDDILVPLDGLFALHKSLAPFDTLYRQKEVLFMHATATPYRERSHFDAQDLLENGSTQPHALLNGWLNRAVGAMQGKAIAIGPSVPLVLRGDAPVESWAPSVLPALDDDFLSRVSMMYGNDPLLSKTFAESLDLRHTAQEDGMNMGKEAGPPQKGKGNQAFSLMMKKAAEFLSAPDGARIASIDIGGWDTHAGQGTVKGRLPSALETLAGGISDFRAGMSAAWKDTAVLVVTEFGRTVRGNGTGGTDHGTGSVAMLLGGGVSGGRMIGDWPGLGKLYQDRDLMPANDMRSLLKGVLSQHLGISDDALATQVFPESAKISAQKGLFIPA